MAKHAIDLRRRRLAQGAALAPLAAWAAASQAAGPAGFGDKPLRIIVPFTAGGSSDIIARAISTPLGEALGTTVIVDNKVGANGNIGADFVAKSPPDGHTLLMCDVRALAISPSLYTKLPFDPSRNLQTVAMLAYSPHLLVVHPDVPAGTLAELVALSKRKPLSFAVTALASAPHLAGVQLQERTGALWDYVPYKGGSQAINDTIAGQTDVLMNGMLATLPFVQAKRLKILAVSSKTRVPLLADVPTIAETVPNFESGTWQGMLGPAGIPAPLLARISAELVRVIRLPAVREQLVAQGAEVSTMAPADMGRFFETERKTWAAVVAKAGLKLD
ncbi:MAG: tripartite tricarboxylate transporter substrate binding protein [Pseudomonadota bacterium]